MRILLPTLLTMAACTPSAGDMQARADADAGTRAALDRELVGLSPGPSRACVDQTRLRGSRTFGDTVVYDGPGPVRYVSRTTGGCSQAGFQGFLVTSTPSTSLCRGDIARVVDRATRQQIGACSFGPFTTYSPAR